MVHNTIVPSTMTGQSHARRAGQVERLAASMMKNQYGQYLMDMLNETNTLRTRP